MSEEEKATLRLEIAHVLFIDIVGYSKLLINEQSEQIQTLKEIVRGTEQFRVAEAEGKLLRLPTGDGGALVFRDSPEAPVLCALEISKELKKHPELHVRMGIHSGPVNEVTDLNEQANIAGAGINIAQRVMDCGDAGHILLSKRVADDLEHYPRWRSYLHSLGEFEAKHGARIGVVNLYGDGIGNPQLPKKVQALKKKRARVRRAALATAFLFLAAVVAAFFIVSKRSTTRGSGVPEKSIAVLPFENLSEEKSNAYFAEGIQDEILTKLASIADLKVISRTSTAKYQSKPDDLKTVSQQLGVANVVEGTVQRAADQVRVNVQLIDARRDTHLWAKTYDRAAKDVFAVESEVSQEIADALQAKLSPTEANNLATIPTKNPEAYDLFLKGEYEERQAENSLKVEAFDHAAVFYQEALKRDPNFALAAARLANSRILRQWFFVRAAEAELAEIKAMAEHAVALAPNLPEAHLAFGSFYYYGDRQYDQALAQFHRALELRPNDVAAQELIAWIYRRQGKWDQALAEMAKCEGRDPRNPTFIANFGTTYLNLRMWQDARRLGSRAMALDPQSVVGMRALFLSYLNGSKDLGEAKRIWSSFPSGTTLSNPSQIGNVATIIGDGTYLYVVERDFGAALKAWENKATNPDRERLRLAARASVHVLAGDADRAQGEIANAQILIEARLREQPSDLDALTELSWVNLALNQNSEALRLAKQAADLLPVEKDAMGGPSVLAGLAQIQARAGGAGEAVKTLRRLLSIPAGVSTSIQRLKIDPVWDPIRNDSGFQQLLTGQEHVGP
jgi:TolB-like protein/Flp pilus assembly protein TadD